MANVNAPNGFEPVGLLKGAPTLGNVVDTGRLSDQNRCAQSRRPMDMMVQGCATSLFQASQQ